MSSGTQITVRDLKLLLEQFSDDLPVVFDMEGLGWTAVEQVCMDVTALDAFGVMGERTWEETLEDDGICLHCAHPDDLPEPYPVLSVRTGID